jgi:hypothetical protein
MDQTQNLAAQWVRTLGHDIALNGWIHPIKSGAMRSILISPSELREQRTGDLVARSLLLREISCGRLRYFLDHFRDLLRSLNPCRYVGLRDDPNDAMIVIDDWNTP